MAQENNRINVSELDFDQIKNSLKQFLRGQPEFSDYDFEGAGLSVLLDILSYNTHYNALYNNFAINELFLDSATKRDSIVSRAKELGYTPRSASCSQAVLNMSITATDAEIASAVISIPKYTPFTSSVNGTTFSFYTTETLSAVKNFSGVYNFGNFTVKEGSPLTYKYTVSDGQRYIIPNANADISTLTVKVQDSSSSTNFTTFTNANNIIDVRSTDTAYFVREIENQLYEVIFGDDIIGKKLSSGNVVHLEYFVTNRSAANGARVFNYNGASVDGTIALTVVTPSFNGNDIETIESIKYNAPKFYSAQNRAVTNEDYKTLIYNGFPEAKSISVWGGHESTPPVYGKVFICIKPYSTDSLTTTQKDYILNTIIGPKKTVSIIPEIIDPQYINVSVDVTVYYNERETSRSSSDLVSLVQDSIINYNDTDLEKFDSVFRFSKLSRLIDTSEQSITNNSMRIKLYREVTPIYNSYSQYIINLINPIYSEGVPEEAVTTTGFYIADDNGLNRHYLIDDGLGNIELAYKQFDGTKTVVKVVNPTIGTVDYAKGIISVSNLNIIAIEGDTFEFIIKPESNDVISVYEQIVKIDQARININVIADKTSAGVSAVNNYIFTSTAK